MSRNKHRFKPEGNTTPWLDVLCIPLPDEIRDGRNRPVPSRLGEVFAGRVILWEWCRRLDLLKSQLGLQQDAPHCRDIDCKKIVRLLGEIAAEVKRGAPFGRCDCPGWELDCPRCDGTRWTSQRRNVMPKPTARALLIGRVLQQATAVMCPSRQTDIARTTVKCGKTTVAVRATGRLAKLLSEVLVNRPVEIIGQLVVHKWKTAGGEDRETMLVEVERVTEIPLSNFDDTETES